MKKLILLFILTAFIFNTGCGRKGGNPVLYYLKNSDLTYYNKMQRDNIMRACSDVLRLSYDDLKKSKYKDFDGNEDKWDMQELFAKCFVPKKSGLNWGDDFYHDVRDDSVKAILGNILITY